MHPRIKQFQEAEWSLRAAEEIQMAIEAVLSRQITCNVMLTGGRSAKKLYSAWADFSAFQRLREVRFYFGDERCVPPEHSESNYNLVMTTLFRRGVPENCSLSRIQAEDSDREAAAYRYEKELPDNIDVLLLGVGEDGHIASLFREENALREKRRKVVPVFCPKEPRERISITPPVIAGAHSVFVLATGIEKAKILMQALQNPTDVKSLPARLVLHATWLFDTKINY